MSLCWKTLDTRERGGVENWGEYGLVRVAGDCSLSGKSERRAEKGGKARIPVKKHEALSSDY